ncbi:MAG: PEP-CTERM sorting domain-containing protein [Limisphaerales bacterium]
MIRNFAFTLAPGGSVNSGSLSQTGTTSSLYTQSSILAEFTGAGNISLSASTFTQSGLTYTGGITFANVTSVDASLTGSVVYNYTPVPEPTTLALAGLGGLSLMLVLRQRK